MEENTYIGGVAPQEIPGAGMTCMIYSFMPVADIFCLYHDMFRFKRVRLCCGVLSTYR